MANKKSTDDFNSRYVQGGSTEVYNTRLGWWERRPLRKDPSDIEYTIPMKYDRRPDWLSYDFYGKTDYYLVAILQYNNILDINEEFITGRKILLPTPQRLMMEIMTQKVGGTKV